MFALHILNTCSRMLSERNATLELYRTDTHTRSHIYTQNTCTNTHTRTHTCTYMHARTHMHTYTHLLSHDTDILAHYNGILQVKNYYNIKYTRFLLH